MTELPNEVERTDRVASVKTIAARVAQFGFGISIREFLDALALASGSLIKAAYRGPGQEVAVKRFFEAMIRSIQNRG